MHQTRVNKALNMSDLKDAFEELEKHKLYL